MPSPIGARRNFQVEPGVLTHGLNTMKPSTESRWLSLLIGVVGLAITTWAFVHWFQVQRAVEALAKQGMYIDITPGPFFRDVRLGFFFVLASFVLLSRRAARHTLSAAVVLLLIIAVLVLVVGGNPSYLRAFLVEAILLLIAVVLWWRKASLPLISGIGPLYLLINYFIWYLFTQDLKRDAEVEILQPDTLLNNTLYEAQWWHVLYLLLSLIMLVWIMRLILVERRNREVTA